MFHRRVPSRTRAARFHLDAAGLLGFGLGRHIGGRRRRRRGAEIGRGHDAARPEPGHQLLPLETRVEREAGDLAARPADDAGQRAQPFRRQHHLVLGLQRDRSFDLGAALRDVTDGDEHGPRSEVEPCRAEHLDARHAPPLARLADQVAGKNGQDVDRFVEAQAELRATAPGDGPVEMLARLELELEPAALFHRNVGMKDRPGRADLADQADVPDAAEHDLARLEDRSIGFPYRGFDRRHLAGQRVNSIQRHPFPRQIVPAHTNGKSTAFSALNGLRMANREPNRAGRRPARVAIRKFALSGGRAGANFQISSHTSQPLNLVCFFGF